MTVDDLIAAYIEARNAVEWGAEKRGLLPLTNDMSRAGVTAIVRALRDTMVQVHLDGQEFGYADEGTAIRGAEIVVDRAINEILGDAGEKVAEGNLTNPSEGRVIAPATDPYEPITGVTDYHRGKTTDAAPAVCVWKLADPDVVESGCGQPYSAEVMRDICPSCGKPIAFKDANHG